MRITIVGAGNVGMQLAVHCAQNNDVTLYTSRPEEISNHIKIVDENNKTLLESNTIISTDNLDDAFLNTDLILITYPAFSMKLIADKIYKYVKKDLKIGLIPGTGGGECAFKQCLDKGAIIFGLQRVPSVARIVEKGKTVRAIGYRSELFVGSLPNSERFNISEIISDILDMKCGVLPNYLNLTLTPSNPILHTTRLRTIFKDYFVGKEYDSLPLFYENWDNETSELLFKCDLEVQNICKELCMFDLSYVKSLKEHYESNTPEQLTNKIKSIIGFKGLTTPSIRVDNKYIPDFNSRYFTADFSYGLEILVQIGNMLGVDITNINETMQWYLNLSKNEDNFSFENYGITTLTDFIDFYSM